MDIVTLDRFELTGPLGSGADYDVRAAVDRDTGQPVVLKRPSPQAVRRQMHGPIEQRTDRILTAYEAAGQHCPPEPAFPSHASNREIYYAVRDIRRAIAEAGQLPAGVPRIIGVTEAAIHDAYFGDDVGQPYRVRVEERAYGIPLVGDPRSRILRVPIGLGQNLFTLYPLLWHDFSASWPVQEQLLAAQEVFANAGYTLLDLGPHNVFCAPGMRRLSLVDIGALVGHGVARAYGNAPQDVHDFYLEMLKYYISPAAPPLEPAGYYDPYNQRPIISLEQECDDLTRSFTTAGGELADAVIDCIARVRRRDYASVAEFRQDYQECLHLARARNEAAADNPTRRDAWVAAVGRLDDPHWTRYLFDADQELNAVLNP